MKKHFLKRGIAVLLSAVLAVPNTLPVFSSEKVEVTVGGTRLEESEIPAGESIVYFGATTLSFEEQTSTYFIPVYRGSGEGAEELPEEDVTIHSIDISALYGDDYKLLGSNKKEYKSGKTILEMLMSGELTDGVEHIYDVDAATPSDYRSGTVTEQTATSSDYAEGGSGSVTSNGTAVVTPKRNTATASDYEDEDDDEDEDEDDDDVATGSDYDDDWDLFEGDYRSTFLNSANEGRSQLAILKEQQTGEMTRDEGSSDLSQTLTDAMMNQVVPQLLPQIMYSCEQKIHFEAGQDEAMVEVKILEDHDTEGPETFSLMIVGAEQTRPYGAISTSVVINDGQEAEYSVLTLDQGNYIAEDDQVTVTVSRTGALYSLCTAVLKGTDAEDGTETVYGEVVFMPGEEKKEVQLNISEETEISLCELTAAQLNDTSVSSAVVYPEEALLDGDSENLELYSDDIELTSLESNGNGTREFDITFAGGSSDRYSSSKKYHVIIENGKAYGKIYDQSFSPAVEVGIYVLPNDGGHSGWFDYHKYENDVRAARSQYEDNNKYAWLKWYDWRTWKRGAAKGVMWSDHEELNAVYYQFLTPDWEQFRSRYGGQRSEFWVQEGKGSWVEAHYGGLFSRNRYSGVTYRPQDNGYMHIEVKAVDKEKNKTPQTEIKFYGVVCMYKRFRVTYENPAEKEFRAGKAKISYVPLQFVVDCGAETGTQRQRDIFANLDSKASNLVFTTKAVEINGSTNKFGKISGYLLTLTDSITKSRVTVSYPEDYFKWLDSFNPGANTALPMNAQIREEIKNKAKSDLDRIPYDKYFLKWIDSIQKETISDGFGNAYYQSIHVVPQIDYISVPVTVQLPYGTKSASAAKAAFSDAALSVGEHKDVFHAGDKLDLSVTLKDSANYQVLGYEVSTDGGSKFDSITSTSELVLQPNVSYVIRPLITEKVNAVEIQFEKGAGSYLSIENDIIPQEDLKNYPALKGHTYLNLNPEGKTVLDRMRAVPGKAYSLNILAVKAPGDRTKVYEPYIRHVAKNKTYRGNRYDFIGAQLPADNVLVVGCDTVKRSSFKTCTLKGKALSSLPAIRNDALGKHTNPALGYQVIIGNGVKSRTDTQTGMAQNYVNSIAGAVGADGSFELAGVSGRMGDRMTMLISHGEDDSQVKEFIFGAAGNTINLGAEELDYPILAPRVTSLTYKYGDPTHNINTDLTQNSVLLLDDTLKITAQVDTKGKKITKLIFRSTNTAGATREYTANADSSNPGVYEFETPNLLKFFNNGEKMAVYVVEEATMKNPDGSTVKTELSYPIQQTGLVFYTRNELIAPKTFDTEAVVDQFKDAVNIPLIGSAAGKEQSGKISFSRIDWPDKKGYSLVLSLDAMLYSQFPTMDTKEKLEKLGGFKSAAQKIAKAQAAEEDLKIPSEGQRADDVMDSFGEFWRGIEDNDAIREGADAKAGLNKAASLQFDVLLCMDLEFVYSKETNQYYLATAAVTVGGSGKISKTLYTVIYSIPCYMNFVGTGNISLTLGGVVDDAKNALTAGQFGQVSGNIRQMLTGGTMMAQLDVATEFKAQAGVGMCGVLGARGYVAMGLQFQAGDNNVSKEKVGFVLNGKGGIGLDVLIGSFDFDIINAAKGWGTLKNKTNVTMFNGTSPFKSTAAEEEQELDAEQLETIVYNAYETGEVPDGSNFAPDSLQATPTEVETRVLLDGAADHTRPQLLDLGDGREFLTFLGASESDPELTVLYYAIRSKDGTWSDPARVSEKTKLDLQATLLKKGDKVFIAWSAATDDIDLKTMQMKDILGSLNIYMTSYDLDGSTMSDDLIPLTSNTFLPAEPKLTLAGDRMYCTYALIDYAKAQSEADYLDFRLNYSLFAYTELVTDSENKAEVVPYTDSQGRQTPERIVSIPDETIDDPLVTDFVSEAITLSGEDNGTHALLVDAYTINRDETLQTDGNSELYLRVTDVTDGNKSVYKPIRLSNDSVSESYPQLSKFGSKLYLTWIENGTELRLMDVTEFLSSFFAPDTGSSEMNKSIAAAFKDGSKWNWYQKTYEELGIPEQTADAESTAYAFTYEESIYKDLSENVFPICEATLSRQDNLTRFIQNYRLATDGTDIYIFYTDMCEDYDDTGVELFGLRYQPADTDKDADAGRSTGFSDAVQITDNNKVLDEISLLMTTDREVHLVSNLFEQGIGSDGKMKYGDNQLVYTQFKSKGSVTIDENSLKEPESLVPGEISDVSLTVVNEGLYPTSGFRLTAKTSKNGTETTVYDEEIQAALNTNESMDLQIPWTVPEDVDGTVLTVTVSEIGTAISSGSKASITVQNNEDIVIHDAETYLGEDGKVHVRASVHNQGNTATAARTIKIYNINQDADLTAAWKEKELAEVSLEALEPGEETEIDRALGLSADDFDTFEKVELELRVMNGSEKLSSTYTNFIADQPMEILINDGAAALSLSAGESSALKISSYPEDISAADLIFSSNNNAVATVTEAGVVQAHSAGTAVITVYDPKTGLSKTIIVTVTGGDTPTPTPDNSGSDHDRNAVSTNTIYADGSMPTEVITTGNWQLAADGTWSYLYNGSAIRGRWACIYNSYAKIDLKQKPYAWFRFDDNGIMLTGWYDDTDGNRYYLNPASDNTKGYMYTGWWLIDGKWYYFCEEQGSGRYGALLRNTTTPDGYKVGADGAWIR